MADFSWSDDFQTGGIMQAVEKSAGDGYLRLVQKPIIGSVGGPQGPVIVVPAASQYGVQQYTVCAWYNRTGGAFAVGVFGRKSARDSGISDIEIYSGSSRNLVMLHNRSNGCTASGPNALYVLPPDGEWHFLGVSFDGGTFVFCVDGVQKWSGGGYLAPCVHAGYVLTLGQGYNGYDLYGAMTHFTFWGRPLSPSEQAALMYRIPKPDEPDLLGAWLLNEGSGSVANDFSRFANAGIIYDAPWNVWRKLAGARIVELDLSSVGVAQFSQISWQSTEPAGTGVTIETNLSLDGGQTWQGWSVCTNGGSIPGITQGLDLSNARLKIWEHLHTTDPSVEPVLHSLSVTVSSTPPSVETRADIELRTFHPRETRSDLELRTFHPRETRSDIELTTAVRRETRAEIRLTTWPSYNTFSEMVLSKPVRRNTLAEVLLRTKRFNLIPVSDSVWTRIPPGEGIWTRINPGAPQPWQKGGSS